MSQQRQLPTDAALLILQYLEAPDVGSLTHVDPTKATNTNEKDAILQQLSSMATNSRFLYDYMNIRDYPGVCSATSTSSQGRVADEYRWLLKKYYAQRSDQLSVAAASSLSSGGCTLSAKEVYRALNECFESFHRIKWSEAIPLRVLPRRFFSRDFNMDRNSENHNPDSPDVTAAEETAPNATAPEGDGDDATPPRPRSSLVVAGSSDDDIYSEAEGYTGEELYSGFEELRAREGHDATVLPPLRMIRAVEKQTADGSDDAEKQYEFTTACFHRVFTRAGFVVDKDPYIINFDADALTPAHSSCAAADVSSPAGSTPEAASSATVTSESDCAHTEPPSYEDTETTSSSGHGVMVQRLRSGLQREGGRASSPTAVDGRSVPQVYGHKLTCIPHDTDFQLADEESVMKKGDVLVLQIGGCREGGYTGQVPLLLLTVVQTPSFVPTSQAQIIQEQYYRSQSESDTSSDVFIRGKDHTTPLLPAQQSYVDFAFRCPLLLGARAYHAQAVLDRHEPSASYDEHDESDSMTDNDMTQEPAPLFLFIFGGLISRRQRRALRQFDDRLAGIQANGNRRSRHEDPLAARNEDEDADDNENANPWISSPDDSLVIIDLGLALPAMLSRNSSGPPTERLESATFRCSSRCFEGGAADGWPGPRFGHSLIAAPDSSGRGKLYLSGGYTGTGIFSRRDGADLVDIWEYDPLIDYYLSLSRNDEASNRDNEDVPQDDPNERDDNGEDDTNTSGSAEGKKKRSCRLGIGIWRRIVADIGVPRALGRCHNAVLWGPWVVYLSNTRRNNNTDWYGKKKAGAYQRTKPFFFFFFFLASNRFNEKAHK